MPQKKLQVFVSSTYEDLRLERQAAVEAILNSGHIPAGMELFAAGEESQMTVIKRWIDESDVYLLILGGRYGSIGPKEDKSYIHMEYDYAIKKKKPFFAVVISPQCYERKVRELGSVVTETANPKKLEEFRKLVKSRVVKFWDNTSDIQLAIMKTLGEYRDRTDLKGWVTGDVAAKAQELSQELARLSKSNENSMGAASMNQLIQRTMIEHRFIHQARDLCVMLMPPAAAYTGPQVNGRGKAQPDPVLRSSRYEIVGLLEHMVRIFELVAPPDTKIWGCLRDRRADECYHTFVRAGHYTPARADDSVPMHKENSLTVRRLKESYRNGSCVIITGSGKGPQMWQEQKNDKHEEDKCVLMGSVMTKSYKDDAEWENRKLAWILSVCADREDAFNENHIPLMQCFVDTFSMVANVVVRNQGSSSHYTPTPNENLDGDSIA